MSQFKIKKLSTKDPDGNTQYSVTWPTRKNIQKYRFIVGTAPGLDDVDDSGTKLGSGPGNYIEVMSGRLRMWLQVDYLTTSRLGHTTPEQLA
ncbi:MAG: hypothetical protein JSS38_14795 [Nitrospira sp.]|nr:hypothetical protein [Nitrospira sp.]